MRCLTARPQTPLSRYPKIGVSVAVRCEAVSKPATTGNAQRAGHCRDCSETLTGLGRSPVVVPHKESWDPRYAGIARQSYKRDAEMMTEVGLSIVFDISE